jgi:hypothetical protein
MRLPQPVLILSFLVCVASPSMAGPLTLVVPNNRATSVGNDTDNNNGTSADPAIRFQQIFGSGQFVSVGGSLLIDQFAWRASPGSGLLSISIATVDIYLSTTQYFPNLNGGPANLLTNNFATNLGPDNTHVYSGSINFSGQACDVNGTTPCLFDFVVNFTTPFLYNPTNGRLLMDFFVSGFSDNQHGAFDAEDFSQLPTPYGSVASLTGLANSATGGFSAGGDITRFGYTLVTPEPASLTLVLSGLGLAARMRRRRRT